MKNFFKLGIAPLILVILPTLIQAEIKVEAENYSDAKSLKTEIILENNNTSVGYFDELGEKLTYEVSIPESGHSHSST